MTSRAKENEMMLARLLNISEEEAAERLYKRAVISSNGAGMAGRLGVAIKEQLERTIYVVDATSPCDVEVVLEGKARTNAALKLYVELDRDVLTIDDSGAEAFVHEDVHPLKSEIASCYVASAALARLFVIPNSHQGKFVVEFKKLGLYEELLQRKIVMMGSALLGGGAVGNGFLRALRHVDVEGDLAVVDPKKVRNGNLNRCLYFTEGDEGFPKAERLTRNAQGEFKSLKLTPVEDNFSAYRKQQNRVRRVFVAVDSRRTRRSIQGEAPLEVIDASTTEAKEVVVHSHAQPTEGACLSCVYKFVDEEGVRERDIAIGLGITVEDVKKERIDEEVAARIVMAHPGLDAKALVGVAFDTLFKQLCGEDALKTEGGGQVLAPFAFVSNLAGALLVVELLRLEGLPEERVRGNYFYASPWSPPNVKARRFKARDAACEFCSKELNVKVLRSIWEDVLAERAG